MSRNRFRWLTRATSGPLVPTQEYIIVPRQVLDGLLSALQVHLSPATLIATS